MAVDTELKAEDGQGSLFDPPRQVNLTFSQEQFDALMQKAQEAGHKTLTPFLWKHCIRLLMEE